MPSSFPLPPTSPSAYLPLAYSVPSLFSNQTHFTFLNGMVRITFMEQICTEEVNVCVPRSAISMTYEQALDLARKLGEFVKTNLAGAKEAGVSLQ